MKCTWLAERATDVIGRETLKIIRDAWITIANDGEVVGLTDPKAVLLILDQSKTEKAIPSDPRKL